MKKIGYRLQFKIRENGSKEEIRDNRIDDILSIDIIETESPLTVPTKGSTLVVNDEDYITGDISYKYQTEGDMVYYTTIVLIWKKIPELPNRDYREIIEEYLKISGHNRWDNRGFY